MSIERRLLLLSILLPALMMPSAAEADIAHLVFTATCDKSSHTLTLDIQSFGQGEDPELIIKQIREGTLKDTFYFSDLATSHKPITCNLGNGAVSFTAGQDTDHPRNDDLWFYDANGKSMGGWFVNIGGDRFTVRALGDNAYDLSECQTRANTHSFKKGECHLRHGWNN